MQMHIIAILAIEYSQINKFKSYLQNRKWLKDLLIRATVTLQYMLNSDQTWKYYGFCELDSELSCEKGTHSLIA